MKRCEMREQNTIILAGVVLVLTNAFTPKLMEERVSENNPPENLAGTVANNPDQIQINESS